MKLHLTQSEGNQLVTGYGDGWIEINNKRYTKSLIVLPNLLIQDWQVSDFDSLAEESFRELLELKPEVVLLGNGEKHRFLHPRISRELKAANISMESMDTAAACRTYNILMAVGRRVAAALIV